MLRVTLLEQALKKISEFSKKESTVHQKSYLASLRMIDNPTDLQVIEILNEKGGMTRGDLAKIIKIPRSTLYDSLTRLQLAGLVNKYGNKTKKGPGRSLVIFESTFSGRK
ncbi:MAG: helix-turn-helix domain-containing protein [Candidatus Odinarchaeota archaeon]